MEEDARRARARLQEVPAVLLFPIVLLLLYTCTRDFLSTFVFVVQWKTNELAIVRGLQFVTAQC